jgi:hypothetical protein
MMPMQSSRRPQVVPYGNRRYGPETVAHDADARSSRVDPGWRHTAADIIDSSHT